MRINIVLVEPEIPANTGNVARTCAVTGARLHLVEPLGFSIDDKRLKRAGLDYWPQLNVKLYKNLDEFFSQTQGGEYYYCTTKAKRFYNQVSYGDGCYIIFGKETKGLPEILAEEHPRRAVRIPMRPTLRSLNLSNSVAIVVYEALRQQGFPDMT
ncbi:MAG: tRNA (cytidine(34)-2'-O)-methyltransferase [Christensenellales bacterium]